MFDDQIICPYTGLRSFTEEESLYFKGRDEHIHQATEMLQRNKFLMLTGASGDGKSSLVYAGIIPNARAGFLKAPYSNWRVADFRPERAPFDNLCRAIATALNITSVNTVKSELHHGFSALTDLYRSSKLYVDKQSDEWINADEKQQRILQQQTANLLIMADQFEEYFTNPENYIRGVPSNDSFLTVNLLLETARIALEENLPIYIVFTMRSDYIGQCAAFRGLPEYIGFSQFFVPRLNRKELQEVIEEPATLSGNQISRRLTERLIHDVIEGVDQLPILQHALNQIWKSADDGKEEMDLIHYAMVGGLSVEELPENDQKRFNSWFDALPKSLRDCYKSPSLQSVLDTHANKNYASGSYYYEIQTGKELPHDLAHLIIQTTFVCLTKIDHSRAVRNRMDLEEITEIINHPQIDQHMVNEVINIFREPGNTFIHPFIQEDDPETRKLSRGTVLDITHESLIRNWSLLREWAESEFDKFTTFADFKQQVDRWLAYDRSWGFLLPIGSLTYFEEWFNQVKPNEYWVNRYNEQVTDTAKDLDESKSIVKNCYQFLRRSATKHLVTRKMIQWGPKKIAAAVSILLLLSLSSFTYYNHLVKTDDFIMDRLHREAIEILNEDHALNDSKAFYLISRERVEPGSFVEVLDMLEDDRRRLNLSMTLAQDLLVHDSKGEIPLKNQVIIYADSISRLLVDDFSSMDRKDPLFNDMLNLAEIIEYHYYYSEDENIRNLLNGQVKRICGLVNWMMDHPWKDMNIKKLNEGIELGLNHKGWKADEISQIIEKLEDETSPIQSYYSEDKLVGMEAASRTFAYNGKYQLLAELYGVRGDVINSIKAVEIMMSKHDDYDKYATDGNTVAGYFALYDHWEALDEFAEALAQLKKIRKYEEYRQIVDRIGHDNQSINARFAFGPPFGSIDNWVNPVLEYLPEDNIRKVYHQYDRSMEEGKISRDEYHFAKAIAKKQIGVLTAKRYEDKSRKEYEDEIYGYFEESFKHYDRVSEGYLNEEILVRNINTSSLGRYSRRAIFIYPDHRDHVHPHQERTRFSGYYTGLFLQYIIDKNLLIDIYPTYAEAENIVLWIREYSKAWKNFFSSMSNRMETDQLAKIDSALSNHPESRFVNLSLLRHILAIELFDEEKLQEALQVSKKISTGAITSSLDAEINFENRLTLNNVAELTALLAKSGQDDLAHAFIAAIPNAINRASLLDYIAVQLLQEDQTEKGRRYMEESDSVLSENSEIRRWLFKFQRSYATALIGDEKAINDAKQQVVREFDFLKHLSHRFIARSASHHGFIYEGSNLLPKYPSSEERLNITTEILYGKTYYDDDPVWARYDSNREFFFKLVPID